MTTPRLDAQTAYLRRMARTAKIAKLIAFLLGGILAVLVVLALLNVGTTSAHASQLDAAAARMSDKIANAQQAKDTADTSLSDAQTAFLQKFMANRDSYGRDGASALAADPPVAEAKDKAQTASLDLLTVEAEKALFVIEAAKAHANVGTSWAVTIVVIVVGVVVTGVALLIAFGLSTSAMRARATVNN